MKILKLTDGNRNRKQETATFVKTFLASILFWNGIFIIFIFNKIFGNFSTASGVVLTVAGIYLFSKVKLIRLLFKL